VRRVSGRSFRYCALLVLAGALAAPAHANSHRPPCTGHWLGAADKAESRRAIEQTAGVHEVVWSTRQTCTWRNGRSKHKTVWVDLKTETRADGSTVARSLHCYEDLDNWECEVFLGRNLDTSVVTDGTTHKIHLWLPDELPRDDAEELLARSFALAPVQTVAENCALQFDRTPTSRERELLPHFVKSFVITAADWHMSIEQWSARREVHAGNFYLEFEENRETPGQYDFKCWDLYEPLTMQ
jgi:hypothetical protein